jgi:hypothetical protein
VSYLFWREAQMIDPRAYAMTEAELQAAVKKLCAHFAIRYYHTHDSRRSDPGFPDVVAVGAGLVFAELKSQRGQLAPEQRQWAAALRKAGQAWYLWRPADLYSGEIARILTGISPLPVAAFTADDITATERNVA